MLGNEVDLAGLEPVVEVAGTVVLSQIATKLENLANALSPEDKQKEQGLRPVLLGAWQGFKSNRFAVGKALHDYQRLFKEQKKAKGEIKRFDLVLDALGCERSQAYRFIRNYTQAMKVPVTLRNLAEARGIDLGETKHARLVSQLQERRGANSPDRDSPDADLLNKAIKAVEMANKAAAPTITKETGSIPIPPLSNTPVNHAVRKAELIAEYRKRFVSEAEADRAIDAVIVAALEAQLGKLPVLQEAA